MNPTEKVELIRLIQQIQKQFNLSVLLVEHSMKVVMGVCQRIAVLDYGVKIAEGAPGRHPVRSRRSSRPTSARITKSLCLTTDMIADFRLRTDFAPVLECDFAAAFPQSAIRDPQC